MTDRKFQGSQEDYEMLAGSPSEQGCPYGQYQSVTSAPGINLEDREQIRSRSPDFHSYADISSPLGRLRGGLHFLSFPSTKQSIKSAYVECRRRSHSRMWKWARIGLSTIILLWTGYCTTRYFIAFRIYGNDTVRSQYALGMAIVSFFTLIAFASEATLSLLFFRHYHYDKITRLAIHSLTYFSSALAIGLTIINLILLQLWRSADQQSHSIEGRCNWDVDVVWSGTGLSCRENRMVPFGHWESAAILRLVISLIILTAYHLAVHVYLSTLGERSPSGASMQQVAAQRPTRNSANTPLMLPQSPRHSRQSQTETIIFSEEDQQRRSLSFTAAGQVLSRVEVNEDHSDQNSSSGSEDDSTHCVEGDAQDGHGPIQGRSTPDVQLESHNGDLSSPTYRATAPPSNHLQDLASAFQAIPSTVMQETHEAMLADHPSPMPPKPSMVRILGSDISRMSTISSMGSREASSPVSTMAESPISRNSTLNVNQRRDSYDMPQQQQSSHQQARSSTPPVAGSMRHRRPSPSPVRGAGSLSPLQSDTEPPTPPSRKSTESLPLAQHDPASSRPPSRLATASPLSFQHDISKLQL